MSSFIPDVTEGQTKNVPRGTSAADIHNPFAEGKGHCPPGGGPRPGCFLNDWQRLALAGLIGHRVTSASAAFGDALGVIGLEEALRKEPDVDLLTGLVIDALGHVAGGAIKAAAKFVRGSAASAVTTGEIAMIGIGRIGEKEWHDPVQNADESSIGFAMKSAVDAGKAGLKREAQAGTDFDRDQAAVKGLLAQMRSDAPVHSPVMME